MSKGQKTILSAMVIIVWFIVSVIIVTQIPGDWEQGRYLAFAAVWSVGSLALFVCIIVACVERKPACSCLRRR